MTFGNEERKFRGNSIAMDKNRAMKNNYKNAINIKRKRKDEWKEMKRTETYRSCHTMMESIKYRNIFHLNP